MIRIPISPFSAPFTPQPRAEPPNRPSLQLAWAQNGNLLDYSRHTRTNKLGGGIAEETVRTHYGRLLPIANIHPVDTPLLARSGERIAMVELSTPGNQETTERSRLELVNVNIAGLVGPRTRRSGGVGYARRSRQPPRPMGSQLPV